MTFADIIASIQGRLQNVGQNLQQGRLPSPNLPQVDPNEAKRIELLNKRAELGKEHRGLQEQLAIATDKNIIYGEAKGQGYIPQTPVTLSQLMNKAEVATEPQPEVLGTRTAQPSYEDLLALVIERAKGKGYHPAPVAGQFASESARGQSNFAKNKNNYWGIGAFDSNLGNTWNFDTPEDSIDAYFDLIEKDPRYAEAYKQRANPEAYIKALAPIYATDPNYARTIMNTPEWRNNF